MLRFVEWDTCWCIQIRWITCSWYPTSYTLDLYLGDLWYNTLSCSPLTHYTCATLWDYLIASILFHYSVIMKANSDYINLDYSDVRCRIFIWGFSYLDYFFNVLISRIGNVGITDFSVVTLLTVSFHVHMCLYSRYTFYVHICLICTPLGFIVCTRRLHLTILNFHVQI